VLKSVLQSFSLYALHKLLIALVLLVYPHLW